jgi:hypothetical protein
VLTVFSVPKPFAGHIGLIQRNAVESWKRLHPHVQVILFGDVAAAAAELGVEHAEIARNEHGTPLLNAAFECAEDRRRHDLLCFVNADVILFRDLVAAVGRVRADAGRFLLVGESWNARIEAPLLFDAQWEERLGGIGRKRGADAIDYFVFSAGLFAAMPPFAVGRTAFDNWLIWHARRTAEVVVDATPVVHPLHQDHDYGHFAGGLDGIRASDEARRNRELAGGGKERLYSRFDATHVLTRRGLRQNLGAPLRWKERSRRAVYKLRQRVPAP